MISTTEFKNFNKKFDVAGVFMEHEGKILLLHRQDGKIQGDRWGVPAGKADQDETLLDAIARETEEEAGFKTEQGAYKYMRTYYLRYPGNDLLYHVYHLPVQEKPVIVLNPKEHKDYRWVGADEALRLTLMEDEDVCIRDFYKNFL